MSFVDIVVPDLVRTGSSSFIFGPYYFDPIIIREGDFCLCVLGFFENTLDNVWKEDFKFLRKVILEAYKHIAQAQGDKLHFSWSFCTMLT